MITLARQRLLNQAISFQATRTFLTNQQLGIDRFIYGKEKNVQSSKDIIVANIKKSIEGDGFVYTEDLKGLAYALDTPEDAKLLKDAFIKFASSGEPVRIATFKIGPVVSRALYQIDDLDSLKELVENEKTSEYFNLKTAVNVYLSFLYKKEHYQEVLDAAEKMFEQAFSEVDLSSRAMLDNSMIVYLAAANKIGSKDALDRARKLLHKYGEKISTSTRDFNKRLRLKQVMLFHLLCIKNNELNEALEVLSQFNTSHYEFLNAKASILIKLGRAEECLAIINKILEPNNNRARYVFTETIDIIKKELEKNPHEQLKLKIDSLTQDVILDAKIEDTIIALPNVNLPTNQNRFGQQQGFRRFGNNRFGDNNGRAQFRSNFNRFGNNNRFNDREEGSGGFNRFNNRSGGFNRRDDNFGNNGRFNNSRFNNDDFSDGSRRPFRPFQTKFRDAQESNDFI